MLGLLGAVYAQVGRETIPNRSALFDMLVLANRRATVVYHSSTCIPPAYRLHTACIPPSYRLHTAALLWYSTCEAVIKALGP